MRAFFSGTDWENLEDRACTSNYFLMLIVNFDGNWCAKVAYKGIQKGYSGVELEFANNADGLESLKLGGKKDKDVLVVMDCALEKEEKEIVVEDKFKARYEAVLAVQKAGEEEKRRKEAQKKKDVKEWHKGAYGTWKDSKFREDAWSGPKYNKGMLGDGYGDWGQTPPWWDDVPFEGGEDDDYEYVLNEHQVWVKTKKKEKKDKKISEMTEKEWNKSQQPDKFDIRHAKCFLNSVLYGTYMPNNFNDCISKIESDDKKITTVKQLDEYVEDFEDLLQEHFDVLWPKGTVEEYNELLGCVVDYLLPYKYNRLIGELIDAVEEEIVLTSNII